MTEVTQADRNRANRWLDRPNDTPVRRSESDRLAYKFARHREQSAAEERAKIVAWIGQWIDDTGGQDIGPQYLIEKIEAGEHLK